MSISEHEFNEHKIPPGGWTYYQPETKWRAPTPISSTLSQTVMLVVKMRKANPAITAKFKLATNPEAVKSEILRYNRKRLGLPEEGVPLPFRASRKYPGDAAGVVAVADSTLKGLKRAAQGTAVVVEWLGKGAEPVARELAEKRAATCVKCQHNQPGAWFTEAPAELIKKSVETWKQMTGKSDFEFTNSQGDNLKSCGVCKCLLSLKIWVGLDHIIPKTPQDVMREFPDFCWVKNRDA